MTLVHETYSKHKMTFEAASPVVIGTSSNSTTPRDQYLPELGSPSPGILASAISWKETLFVAVSKEVNECKSTVAWAVKHSGGRKIGFLHVYQPAQRIPTPMGKFPADKCSPKQVEIYREDERKQMHNAFDEYRLTSARGSVDWENPLINENVEEKIEEGIIHLVIQHGVKLLVMGGAADKHYSPRTKLPKSKKAISVSRNAPLIWCNIWFICDGKLVCSREAGQDGSGVYVTPPSPVVTLPRSPAFFSTGLSRSTNGHGATRPTTYSLHDNTSVIRTVSSAPNSRSSSGHSGDSDSILPPSHSSSGSNNYAANDEAPNTSSSIPASDAPYQKKKPSLVEILEIKDGHDQSIKVEGSKLAEEELFEQLQQSMVDANNCRRDAYEESVRRRSAEKQALEASHKMKQSELAYMNEMKRRKEVEEKLAQETLNLEAITIQYNQEIEELQRARDLKLAALKKEVVHGNQATAKLASALSEARDNLDAVRADLETCKREKEEAIKSREELIQKIEEANSSFVRPQAFSQFSYSEIEEATRGLDDSLKIGGGGYGSVYEGLLRHTHVAIKILNPDGRQGENEFKHEMEILTRVRHPNLVTLIGTCPDSKALIYEYLPNGSLEDRLLCKNNAPPLSWQTRVRILYHVCSALVFLHSVQPHCIVHGDLKPANILLDANLVAKLGDFGISRLIPRPMRDVTADPSSGNCTTTLGWITDPKGTFAYIDPEFVQSGVLTPRSDVYSFGVVILRVLTKSPAMGIVNEVKEAVEDGKLDRILDATAGGWPCLLAKQLAELGLQCCEMNRKERPQLESVVWTALERMMKSAAGRGFDQKPPSSLCPLQ